MIALITHYSYEIGQFIGFLAFISAIFSIITFFKMYNDHLKTKNSSTLYISLGLLFYGIGHFIASLDFIGLHLYEHTDLLTDFIYISFSGGISMSFFIKAGLESNYKDYFQNFKRNNKNNFSIINIIAITYCLFYLITIFIFGYILPGDTDLIFFINPIYRSRYTNMGLVSVIMLIPPSLILSKVYYNYKEKEFLFKDHNISFYFSMYFFLYSCLLTIWIFDETKIIFFAGKVIITIVLLWGVREGVTETILKERLEEAEKETNFLLELLVHDVKNILNVLNWSVELLGKEDDPIKKENYIKSSLSGLEKINKVIKNVEKCNDVSRKLANNNSVNLHVVNVEEKIKKEIENILSLFSTKNLNISLNYNLKPNESNILGNELFDEMIINLLNNSIYHSDKESIKINIELNSKIVQSKNFIEMIISDNGPGINRNIIDNVFKTQIAKDGRIRLGCVLVGRIVKLLKGEILVDKEYTEGTQITVLLPMYNLISFKKAASLFK